MRIIPLALIVIGTLGVLKHFGLIDATVMHLLWPLLLIGIGVAMLLRAPRWRADMRERMQDRWERRMHRHFGAGWAKLSEAERERFRSGMRQWQSHADGGGDGPSPAPPSGDAGSSPKSFVEPRAPGEQR